MIVTEEAGGTLSGAIDGENATFVTSLAFDPESVTLYVNGRNKVRELDDGFAFAGERALQLKEAPLPGDTVAVQYEQPGEASLGGAPYAPGPRVRASAADALQPRVCVSQPEVPRVVRVLLDPCCPSFGGA